MSLASRIVHVLRPAAARIMRPGLRPVFKRLDRIDADVSARLEKIEKRLALDAEDTHKYESELDFWRWMIQRGGAEKKHGEKFEIVFGRWQRHRLLKLADWLLLPGDGDPNIPGGIDDWCADRSVVEIGAGPYPSAAAARKGWKRCVAVDPLARGYCENNLLPPAADRVVYMEAPGERIPLPSGFADIVINENCLDHVSDPAAVVREMHRLLKPGGLLWFFVDLSNHVDHMHPHPMDEQRVRELFHDFFVINAEVTHHKAHPEAYGSVRALFRKPRAGETPDSWTFTREPSYAFRALDGRGDADGARRNAGHQPAGASHENGATGGSPPVPDSRAAPQIVVPSATDNGVLIP